MEISNKKRTKKIKLVFNLVIVFLLVLALFFVWNEKDLEALVTGGVLVLYILAFQLVNLNYIYYSSNGDDFIVRYYPLITFFGKEYNSIEFNKSMFYFGEVKKSFLFSDLFISIKTQKGIAEYPEISLSALKKTDIQAIKEDLECLKKTK